MMTITAPLAAAAVVSAVAVVAIARLIARSWSAGDVRQVRVSPQWLAQYVSKDVRD